MSKTIIRNKKIKFKRTITNLIKDKPISFSEVQGWNNLYELYCIDEKISKENLLKIMNYLSLNPDRKKKLIEYLQDVGDKFDFNNFIKYESYLKKNKGKFTVYDPIKVSLQYNISIQEAEIKIQKAKDDRATTEVNFIRRYGEEEGKKLFKKFQEDSKHTKEKYINKYGKEQGEIKWKEYTDKKGARSVFRSDYWINQGYSPEEAEQLRKDFHKNNLSTSSIDYWISKGFSEQAAKDKVDEIFNKKQVMFANASKQSLKYFDPLIKFLTEKGFECNLGVKGNKEYSIYDKETKRLYFYDFTVPSLKLIIEFNGYKFHPNPNKLTKEEWDNWRVMTKRGQEIITADQAHEAFQIKKKVARDAGFNIVEIWSNDTIEENWNTIYRVFREKNIRLYGLRRNK
jgi:hypothetical protein